MASSPASRRNLYTNNRDYPGCMGGFMHLFDFNQALAGRKLLTDKKSGAVGLEAPRNSLDVGGNIPEVPKPHVEKSEEVPYGYELQKVSGSRKSNGVPIKALIAQELAKEADSKNRAPSVVARLMGLEALPTDSKALQKPPSGSILGKMDEKFTQKPMVERQRHEEIAPHSIRLYAKKAKASAVSGQNTPKSSRSQRSESQDRKPGSEPLVLRNHPQEQQLQEFKKEFEAWQTQKSWAHSKRSSRLDDTHVRMPSQQGLPRERQLDTKSALPRESFPSQKVIGPEERLHESREFQDALDFLQSNKEFFMRFIHEPNSLFARHLQDNESDSISSLEATKGTKHRRPQQASDASESPRPQPWARDSPLSRQSERIDSREESRPPSWPQESPISRSPGGPLLTEKGKPSMPHSPLVNSEESLGLHDQRSYAFSPGASQSRLHSPDSHIPTRIVVLKPSPGRVRNLKSPTPVYFRSPKDHTAYDALREDNTEVLERLREKLRKDNSDEYKPERKGGIVHINEHYRDASKDPREIAREIARQVRENITRDLMVDPRYSSNVHSTTRKKSAGRRPVQFGDYQDSTCTYADPSELTGRTYWDSYTRSSRASLQRDNNFDLEAMRSSMDEKAHIVEQVKRRVSDNSTSQGYDLRIKNIVFDKDSQRRDSHRPATMGLKTSLNSKGSGKFTVDGLLLSQPQNGSLFNDSTGQVADSLRGDSFGLEHHDSVEHSKASFQGRVIGEEAENVPDLQVYECAAELSSESVKAIDLRRPTAVDADSIVLATSDANLGVGYKLVTAEVKQTIIMREELDGSQASEDVVAVNAERKQQSDGEGSVTSLCGEPSVYSRASTNAEDFTNTGRLQANDSRLELIGKSEAQEVKVSDSVQTLESAQTLDIANNDYHAPLDSTPAHNSPVSLSTCESNFIIEPVKEQPEQPSPVSVLDLPFQDDTSITTEFKELSSDLEELRMRLRLLNFDNGDEDPDNDDSFESELDASIHPEEVCNVEEDHLEHLQTNKNDSLGDICFTVADWKGEDSEICYIRDVLAASGLMGDSSSVLTQWFAPGQPLNPHLFENLEKGFSKEKKIQELNQATSELSIQEAGDFNVSRRHLLFDCANEALLDLLGPYLNRRVWLSSKFASPMPTGKDLVKLVWTRVWCAVCSHSGSQETLENLVTKDLGKGNRWLDIGVEIEAAGLDVERAILDDLIEETLLVL